MNKNDFVKEAIKITKKNGMEWTKVEKRNLRHVIDRTLSDGFVAEAYYNQKKDTINIVIIGRVVVNRYIDADTSFPEDFYFITFSDNEYEDKVTYFESDEGVDGLDFAVNLSRLLRLAQLSYNNIDEKITGWFD